MTSYDQIWETFLNNCETSDFDVPQQEEDIYKSIRNAILHFNNRLRDNLKADNSTETVNRELSEDDLLILAHFLRYIFLLNKRPYLRIRGGPSLMTWGSRTLVRNSIHLNKV